MSILLRYYFLEGGGWGVDLGTLRKQRFIEDVEMLI